MTCQQIITELQAMGSETIKRIFMNHGAPEPLFGVKVEDLKKIQKKVKKNYELSLELYDTGISDARYLAGLIADEKKMTKKDLEHWATNANWQMISEYTVPWIAAESKDGYTLALQWIEAERDDLQACGWSTLASMVTIKQDSELEMEILKNLLERVAKNIQAAPNRTRYAMNAFVIAVGCAVKALNAEAMETGKKMGTVIVNMDGTACKVPAAPAYIQKANEKGTVGNKKKTARC